MKIKRLLLPVILSLGLSSCAFEMPDFNRPTTKEDKEDEEENLELDFDFKPDFNYTVEDLAGPDSFYESGFGHNIFYVDNIKANAINQSEAILFLRDYLENYGAHVDVDRDNFINGVSYGDYSKANCNSGFDNDTETVFNLKRFEKNYVYRDGSIIDASKVITNKQSNIGKYSKDENRGEYHIKTSSPEWFEEGGYTDNYVEHLREEAFRESSHSCYMNINETELNTGYVNEFTETYAVVNDIDDFGLAYISQGAISTLCDIMLDWSMTEMDLKYNYGASGSNEFYLATYEGDKMELYFKANMSNSDGRNEIAVAYEGYVFFANGQITSGFLSIEQEGKYLVAGSVWSGFKSIELRNFYLTTGEELF